MAKQAKKITQPTLDDEKELDSLLNSNSTTIKVRNSYWKASPLHKGAIRKMTSIMLNEKEEDVVSTKCAAAFRLNGYWAIKLFYPILWRWMFYVKQYTDEELMPFIAECKKKVQAEQYAINIILLIGMKDTTMAMTREEVERIQVEQLSAQIGQSEKSIQASQPQSISSSDSSQSPATN